MALTNAERQAAFKARKAETLDSLAQQNAALLAEVAELRAEVDRLRKRRTGWRWQLSSFRLHKQNDQPRNQIKIATRQHPQPQPHPHQKKNAGN